MNNDNSNEKKPPIGQALGQSFDDLIKDVQNDQQFRLWVKWFFEIY